MEFYIALILILVSVVTHYVSWWAQGEQAQLIKSSLPKLDIHSLNQLEYSPNNLTMSALLSSIGIWLELAASILVSVSFGQFFYPVAMLYIALRFRALQETTHFLIHSKELLAWHAADILFHYPAGKKSSTERHESHVLSHHIGGTLSTIDPHTKTIPTLLNRIRRKRFPKLSLLLRPLEPSTIYRRFASMLKLMTYPGPKTIWRLLSYTAFLSITFLTSGSLVDWLILCIVPIYFIYPLVSWWAELCEHRWLESIPAGTTKVEREVKLGIVFYGKTFWSRLVSRTLLPWGDRFHLIHSINPQLNPRSLRQIHLHLAKESKQYRGQILDAFGILNLSATPNTVLGQIIDSKTSTPTMA